MQIKTNSFNGCEASTRKPREPEFLPARFGHTRDEPVRGEFPESQARNLEAANKRAAAAAHFAAIDHPRGAGIARKLRETHVIFLRLQLSTQGRVFFHGRAFAVVAINPGRFRHKGTRKVAKNAHDATSFLGVAHGPGARLVDAREKSLRLAGSWLHPCWAVGQLARRSLAKEG